MSSSDPLAHLRDSISEVDRALLELLRRRMDLAAEVGRFKASRDLPVVVQDVEDRILDRARQHAEACGVSESVMAAVFQAIMSGSVERQYRVGISLREQRGERVLVLGGGGGMGRAGSAVSWSSPGMAWSWSIRRSAACRRPPGASRTSAR